MSHTINNKQKTKNKTRRLCLFFILYSLFFILPLLAMLPIGAHAQPLVTCGNDKPCTACDIFSLAQGILTFLWTISVSIAALMFAWGGFIMIIPGVGGEKSAGSLEKGKKILTNAVIGIVIVFMAWLGIDTMIKLIAGQALSGSAANINGYGPWNKIECTTSAALISQQGLTGGPGLSVKVATQEATVRRQLEEAGINVNRTRVCGPNENFQSVGGCTNVGGLPSLVISRLISINGNCGGGMVITGGSEQGHQSHGEDKSSVDIAFNPALASCIKKNLEKDPEAFGITRICATDQDASFRLNCTTKETQRHLHLQF